MSYATLEEIGIYDLKKKCFDHVKTLLAYTNKICCNFRDMLTLIIFKKYKINIINFQKIHRTIKTGYLQVYKFLEQKYIVKVLNSCMNKNIYHVFYWEKKIPLLE
jgi:hypothetical protein